MAYSTDSFRLMSGLESTTIHAYGNRFHPLVRFRQRSRNIMDGTQGACRTAPGNIVCRNTTSFSGQE